MVEIVVAKDFSSYPSGRTSRDGKFSGERFREQFLIPALRDSIRTRDPVIVNIDGVRSFGSSFLEESFGGLVRSGEFQFNDISDLVRIKYSRKPFEFYEKLIRQYIREAKPRLLA